MGETTQQKLERHAVTLGRSRLYCSDVVEALGESTAPQCCASCHEDFDAYGFERDEREIGSVVVAQCCEIARFLDSAIAAEPTPPAATPDTKGE